MKARLKKLLTQILGSFWLIPGIFVVSGLCLAALLVWIDRSGFVPRNLIDNRWLYDGGGTGARTLLGSVTSSTIGVAGTVFSITIAALSLAAGQMGPRLLRNFTQDRGNQVTLGAFLGTFCYALMVLRSVRTIEEGAFVPHLSLSVAIVFAVACVCMLVYFVGHMAGRINVDTVIHLVSQDVHMAIQRLTLSEPPKEVSVEHQSHDRVAVCDSRSGYLQQLDQEGLADWAHEHDTLIRLLVRPGDFVFPGTPVASLPKHVDGADQAFRNATALGGERASADDLEFAVRQLVEIAVRALSPGVNDPHTAISVLDRMGTILCEIAPLHFPNGIVLRDDKPVLTVPVFDYDGLADTMFHMIRQSAAGNAGVMIRILEVLTAVASCETAPSRTPALDRHADLILSDAARTVPNTSDLGDVRERYDRFKDVRRNPPLGNASA